MKKQSVRIQGGVVPYIISEGITHVCLVRKKKFGGGYYSYGFPKGGHMRNLSLRQSAEQEAFEEAGLVGKAKTEIGSMEYVKYTGRRQRVVWFLMKVKKSLDIYDELQRRERQWFTVDQALKKLPNKLKKVLRQAVLCLEEKNCKRAA